MVSRTASSARRTCWAERSQKFNSWIKRSSASQGPCCRGRPSPRGPFGRTNLGFCLATNTGGTSRGQLSLPGHGGEKGSGTVHQPAEFGIVANRLEVLVLLGQVQSITLPQGRSQVVVRLAAVCGFLAGSQGVDAGRLVQRR